MPPSVRGQEFSFYKNVAIIAGLAVLCRQRRGRLEHCGIDFTQVVGAGQEPMFRKLPRRPPRLVRGVHRHIRSGAERIRAWPMQGGCREIQFALGASCCGMAGRAPMRTALWAAAARAAADSLMLPMLFRKSPAALAQVERNASRRTLTRSSVSAARAALPRSSLRKPLTPGLTTSTGPVTG